MGFNTSIEVSIPQYTQTVKNQFSFSSPKSNTVPDGVEDFDVKPKDETNPELEKMLSDHDFVKEADGTVRTLAEHRAEEARIDYGIGMCYTDKKL